MMTDGTDEVDWYCPYSIFDDEDEEFKYRWELIWQDLKRCGYLWQDINGKRYTAENIALSHLKNIINFCKNKSWRPEEQINFLEMELKKRIQSND